MSSENRDNVCVLENTVNIDGLVRLTLVSDLISCRSTLFIELDMTVTVAVLAITY